MHVAQLRLPFVFAFQPELSALSRRVRRRIRAANTSTTQLVRATAACDKKNSTRQSARATVAGDKQDATFYASLAAHIQARAAQPPLTTAGLAHELAGLLADTCKPNETPEQLATSLVQHLLRVAG